MIKSVSVIMAAYNAERTIGRTIESIVTQTFQNFEFIIVDDGSTDKTKKIIKEYAAKDKRLKLISQTNSGAGNALNKAMKNCSNEWVVRIDNDDIFLPYALEKQIAFINANPDVKIAGCLGYHINMKEEIIGFIQGHPKTREEFKRFLKENILFNFLHPGTFMHRDTVLALGGYRQQFFPSDDLDLLNRVADQANLILVNQEPLVLYRVHGDSFLTRNYLKGRLYHRWVRECMVRRRRGEPEISLEEFQTILNKRPFYLKFNMKRKDMGKFFYRKAAINFAQKNILKFLFWISSSIALTPIFSIRRLLYQRMPLMRKRLKLDCSIK
jgi:glycosyltransferase involved in cell wall biosynthesis